MKEERVRQGKVMKIMKEKVLVRTAKIKDEGQNQLLVVWQEGFQVFYTLLEVTLLQEYSLKVKLLQMWLVF